MTNIINNLGSQQLSYIIVGVFSMLVIAAVVMLLISLRSQRKYNTQTLPDLISDSPKNEQQQTKEEYAFDLNEYHSEPSSNQDIHTENYSLTSEELLGSSSGEYNHIELPNDLELYGNSTSTSNNSILPDFDTPTTPPVEVSSNETSLSDDYNNSAPEYNNTLSTHSTSVSELEAHTEAYATYSELESPTKQESAQMEEKNSILAQKTENISSPTTSESVKQYNNEEVTHLNDNFVAAQHNIPETSAPTTRRELKQLKQNSSLPGQNSNKLFPKR